MAKAYVITGHYGSGKTNFSVNLALSLKQKQPDCKITVCDLDIVNPYFRTADFKAMLEDKNIALAAPEFANTNLDIPALNFDMSAILDENDYLIIDVGGNDSGATALGLYADTLMEKSKDLEMLYVVNMYRKLTESPNESAELLREIEAASRLKATGIVNNSNLGKITTAENVEDSISYADELCKLTGLSLFATAIQRSLNVYCPKAFLCDVFVKPIWEKEMR